MVIIKDNVRITYVIIFVIMKSKPFSNSSLWWVYYQFPFHQSFSVLVDLTELTDKYDPIAAPGIETINTKTSLNLPAFRPPLFDVSTAGFFPRTTFGAPLGYLPGFERHPSMLPAFFSAHHLPSALNWPSGPSMLHSAVSSPVVGPNVHASSIESLRMRAKQHAAALGVNMSD